MVPCGFDSPSLLVLKQLLSCLFTNGHKLYHSVAYVPRDLGTLQKPLLLQLKFWPSLYLTYGKRVEVGKAAEFLTPLFQEAPTNAAEEGK